MRRERKVCEGDKRIVPSSPCRPQQMLGTVLQTLTPLGRTERASVSSIGHKKREEGEK
jgi:hypothetical protein